MKEESILLENFNQESFTIDDEERLEILAEYISLYYDIGYNFKEYYRYYISNGDLPEDIKCEYTKEGIDVARSILENNKSLSKKYSK